MPAVGADRQERYRGPLGATRRDQVHYACPCGVQHSVEVVVSINSRADPTLARRLIDGDPTFNATVCPEMRVRHRVEVVILYHDPINRLFVLVLPEAARSRELRERAALLLRLADDTAHPVPPYVVGFAVAYGASGLRGYVEGEAERALDASRHSRETGGASAPVPVHAAQRTGSEAPSAQPESAEKAGADQPDPTTGQAAGAADGESATGANGASRLIALEGPEARNARNATENAPDEPSNEQPDSPAEASAPGEQPDRAPLPDRASEPGALPDASAAQPDRASAVMSEPSAPVARPDEASAPVARPDQAGPLGPRSALDALHTTTDEQDALSDDLDAPTGVIPDSLLQRANPASGSTDDDEDLDAATTARLHSLEAASSSQPTEEPPVDPDVWPGGAEEAVRRIGADGAVQILVRAGARELEVLNAPELEVRLQLHRMPNFPLVTLALGAPAALAGDAAAVPPVWVALDIGADADRALLAALACAFEITLQLHDRARGDEMVARRQLSPPLVENAAAVLAAADDYLTTVPLAERSFRKGRAAFDKPEYDRLGLTESHAAELDDAVLDALESPVEVMRACKLVRRFSQPSGEDWLVMTRGYPMPSWQARRRAVVGRAVELGIWPGPVAAQIAVSEGLARTRKDLVVVLQRRFAAVLGEVGHGLDDAVVRDNWSSLRAEARALGLPTSEWALPRSEPIVSESEPVASGTIGLHRSGVSVSDILPSLTRSRPAAQEPPRAAPEPTDTKMRDRARRRPLAHLDRAALVAALATRERRAAAAIELCRRGAPGGIEPVFNSLETMSRAEAIRVFGSVIGFGRAAEPHLVTRLRSRRAFQRQGAALALSVMKSEAGVEAVCDLLLDEPTEIWREVARALGDTGAMAVMPLAARLGQRNQATRERAAWALAHVAARGVRRPLETLAAGRDPVAAGVARRALELVERATRDDLLTRGEKAPRDQTVNRGFSRRFFDAVREERRAMAEAEAASVTSQGAGDTTSGSGLLLDVSDLEELAADDPLAVDFADPDSEADAEVDVDETERVPS
ncbi:MAG TPA: CpXC domain-containing protein [Kofleriaceae bacterium]|nr:CpXC domain-containing protein [Kofleriaceae bacterium]